MPFRRNVARAPLPQEQARSGFDGGSARGHEDITGAPERIQSSRVRWRFASLISNLAVLCLAAALAPGVREAAAALRRGEFAVAETKLRAEVKLRPNDA